MKKGFKSGTLLKGAMSKLFAVIKRRMAVGLRVPKSFECFGFIIKQDVCSVLGQMEDLGQLIETGLIRSCCCIA